MTDTPDQRQMKALVRRPPASDYEVGYGKPPQQTRFKPGQSGNPRGRPKGAKAKPALPALHDERLKSIILEEAYRLVSINDPKGELSIPMAQAVVRSLAVNAAKGNARAQRLFTDLLATTERDNRRLHDEWLQTAIDYKTSWDRELKRRREFSIEADDPLPHPDHIVIDMNSGSVRIKGPMTKEEKVQWDEWRERKREAERTIAELRSELDVKPDHPHRQYIVEDLEHEEKILALLSTTIPD